jgi:hypothetical protein
LEAVQPVGEGVLDVEVTVLVVEVDEVNLVEELEEVGVDEWELDELDGLPGLVRPATVEPMSPQRMLE